MPSTARRCAGFQQIQESDMVLVADPNTAYLDPSVGGRRS